MKIDFNDIPEKELHAFKGGDLHYDASIYDDGSNKIMRGRLVPGASIGMHRHEDSCEIIYVTEGVGTVITDDGEETILPGQCHYCPNGCAHSLVNRGDTDLRIFAVVPNC